MQTTDRPAAEIERLKESYRDSARRWRDHAGNIRDLAEHSSYLTPEQKMALQHEGAASDRQAEWWEKGLAEEFGEAPPPP